MHDSRIRNTSSYPCLFPGCRQILTSKQTLREHGRLHTREQPYRCRYRCGKTFKWRSSLAHHEKTVHTGSPSTSSEPQISKAEALIDAEVRESGMAIVDSRTGESTDETLSSRTLSSSLPRIYTEENSSDLNFEPAVAEWLQRNRSPQSELGRNVDIAFDELLIDTPVGAMQDSPEVEIRVQ
ncbi:hypothetical protein NDN08_001294 [Rhodosorus marinus]|uniref:C2H2-type domain-containing protein n=1 Tax=Rhodosorus marinus TaxID=101924 RepID=A0AAV8URW3_9RHOD|nr:hypothetical protein NDN08_001294 [Rhodosorus marinus]